MKSSNRLFATLVAGLLLGLLAAVPASAAPRVKLREARLSAATNQKLTDRWYDQLSAKYGVGNWAPMRFNLGNRELSLMGLPSKSYLVKNRFRKPTFVSTAAGKGGGKGKPGGGSGGGGGGGATSNPLGLPALTTFAGTGWFGIRPGAWLLFVSGNSIGWCSAAHVYGSPGSYSVSTAGHCGKPGDVVTMIAAFGNRADATGVVLLDIGTISTSHDGGLGNDWALIGVRPELQSLVTPTMAFWGGPRGMFTSQGDAASVSFPGNSLIPTPAVDPNPALVQQIVHYGHGTGIGAGGTPRSGTSISWRADTFMFFGAISPGDSGSGSNTLLGDAPGDNMEAAGINTHLYVDPLMRKGLGVMGGTRATQVGGTLANGQIVPYPVPVPAAP